MRGRINILTNSFRRLFVCVNSRNFDFSNYTWWVIFLSSTVLAACMSSGWWWIFDPVQKLAMDKNVPESSVEMKRIPPIPLLTWVRATQKDELSQKHLIIFTVTHQKCVRECSFYVESAHSQKNTHNAQQLNSVENYGHRTRSGRKSATPDRQSINRVITTKPDTRQLIHFLLIYNNNNTLITYQLIFSSRGTDDTN